MRRVAILLLLILQSVNTHAYDNETVHQLINERAAMQSVNFNVTMNQLGFQGVSPSEIIELNVVNNRTIKNWIREGAKQEDMPDCRSKYHFHDPTKTFDTAGLSNAAINIACLNMNNESSLMWSQHQDNPYQDNPWSWQKGRDYYYQALMAVDKNIREQRFADTFRAMGQVMHLLADASVPEHTRNDIHIFPWRDKADKSFPQIGSWTYETWCKHHAKNLNTDATAQDYSITSTSAVSGLQPIFNFWDTTPLPIAGSFVPVGLAEYSNYNFLSSDTIFKDYVYPISPAALSGVLKVVAAEDGKNDKRVYFSSMTSDNKSIEHLVSTGYLWSDLEKISPYNMDKAKFNLDDNCYEDYADILIPKAVSYSAGLLNYFFRGTLDISWPDAGVYSIADGSKTECTDIKGNRHQQFKKIKVKIKNTTPNEDIKAGTLTAVARYKIIPNYASDLSNYPPDAMTMKAVPEFSYSVSESIQVAAISPDFSSDYPFIFSDNPIPAGITDLTLQIVFKGTIGNEVNNAIAVGMKDLMEPTHLTFWNLTDMHAIDYPASECNLYTFDYLKSVPYLVIRLDDTPGGYPNPLDNEEILKGQSAAFTISFWNGLEWNSDVSLNVPAGGYIRLITLVDHPTDNYVLLSWNDVVDSGEYPNQFDAVVNQVDQSGKNPTPKPAETFRRVYGKDGQTIAPSVQHFYDGFYARTILNGTDCDYPEEKANPVSGTSVPFTSQQFD